MFSSGRPTSYIPSTANAPAIVLPGIFEHVQCALVNPFGGWNCLLHRLNVRRSSGRYDAD